MLETVKQAYAPLCLDLYPPQYCNSQGHLKAVNFVFHLFILVSIISSTRSFLCTCLYSFSLNITVGSPVPVTGFQFGGQLEFGKNCLYDADFGKDVSLTFIASI